MNDMIKHQSPFERLYQTNVNEHVEKKNGLSYLSWPFAVAELLKADPSATWCYPEPAKYGDTMMVFCAVTAFGKTMTAQLPVMNGANKPLTFTPREVKTRNGPVLEQIDSFTVNTAMQRCLAKAIALHGLGLYIYAGEDLPEGPDDPAASVKPTAVAKKELPFAPMTMALYREDEPEDAAYLCGVAAELVQIVEHENDPSRAADYLESLDIQGDRRLALWDVLQPNSKTRSAIKKENEYRAKALKAAA